MIRKAPRRVRLQGPRYAHFTDEEDEAGGLRQSSGGRAGRLPRSAPRTAHPRGGLSYCGECVSPAIRAQGSTESLPLELLRPLVSSRKLALTKKTFSRIAIGHVFWES